MATVVPEVQPLLELRNISKRYGAVQALDAVSLILAAGTVTALVGENGSGKSTLSGVVAGLNRADAGQVLMDGEPVEFNSPLDAKRAGIRIAPQELVLCPELTIAENIGLGHMPHRAGLLKWRDLRAAARERLETLGMLDLDVDSLVGRLSVAEKAMVQIAHAMTEGTRVLIVDEPTAPMSGREADRLMEVIQAITRRGVATVYVSHRLEEVFHLADRAVVLRDGRKVAEFAREQLTRSGLIDAMVGGRDLSVGDRTGRGAESPVALAVSDLAYGTLAGASFELVQGEILGVYGLAGSGREHLGRAVVGAVRRKSGQVRIGRRGPSVRNFRAAVKCRIGYVAPERRSQGLVMSMSIKDNMTLAMLRQLATVGIIRSAAERELARTWLQRLAIAAPGIDTEVRRLSGGSQQKVVLARWLAAGARTLVLEEPTRGVDIATKAEIYRLLRSLADAGGSVLLVSSDLEEIATATDRALVLRGGRIAAELVGADEREIARAALLNEEEDPSGQSDVGR